MANDVDDISYYSGALGYKWSSFQGDESSSY